MIKPYCKCNVCIYCYKTLGDKEECCMQCRLCLNIKSHTDMNVCSKCDKKLCDSCNFIHECHIMRNYQHNMNLYSNNLEYENIKKHIFSSNDKYNSYIKDEDEKSYLDVEKYETRLERIQNVYPYYDFEKWFNKDSSYSRRIFLIDLIFDLKSKGIFTPTYANPPINKWNICLSKSTSNTFVVNILHDINICKICHKNKLSHTKIRWKFFPDGNQCVNGDIFLNTFEEFEIYINSIIKR